MSRSLSPIMSARMNALIGPAFHRVPIVPPGDGCHRVESESDQAVLNGLFAVVEDQPHRVAIQFLAARHIRAQPVADGHQQPVVEPPSLAPTKLMFLSQ
jgi:hypothetical protein